MSVSCQTWIRDLDQRGLDLEMESLTLGGGEGEGPNSNCTPPPITPPQKKKKKKALMAYSHLRAFFSQQENQNQIELSLFHCKITHTKGMAFVFGPKILYSQILQEKCLQVRIRLEGIFADNCLILCYCFARFIMLGLSKIFCGWNKTTV